MEDEEARRKLEAEVTWCIDYLSSRLQEKNLSEKQGRDIFSAIKVLQNSKAPLPKKRQTMRASCGDYRAKMEAEEKKFRLDAKVTKKSPSSKSHFVRHSAARGKLEAGFTEDVASLSFAGAGDSSEPKEQRTVPKGLLNLTSGGSGSGGGFRFNFGSDSQPPAASGGKSESASNDTSRPFKYVPSDNSFRFGFATQSNN